MFSLFSGPAPWEISVLQPSPESSELSCRTLDEGQRFSEGFLLSYLQPLAYSCSVVSKISKDLYGFLSSLSLSRSSFWWIVTLPFENFHYLRGIYLNFLALSPGFSVPHHSEYLEKDGVSGYRLWLRCHVIFILILDYKVLCKFIRSWPGFYMPGPYLRKIPPLLIPGSGKSSFPSVHNLWDFYSF